jgi:hypothetical protein
MMHTTHAVLLTPKDKIRGKVSTESSLLPVARPTSQKIGVHIGSM